MNTQPEALRLAEVSPYLEGGGEKSQWIMDAAAELRRLHALNAELLDAADMALNTLIGCCVSAGGVDDQKTILEAQGMLRAAIAKAEAA